MLKNTDSIYENETRQRIKRLWLNIMIHSYMYYEMGKSIISDSQWDAAAKELVELKNEYPEIAKHMPHHEYLLKFDGSTGYDLPKTGDIYWKALYILKLGGLSNDKTTKKTTRKKKCKDIRKNSKNEHRRFLQCDFTNYL